EAGLLREAHVAAQHGVVAQRDVGRLVPLHALAVRGPVVHVLLHALLGLVLVDAVGHGGAGHALQRGLQLEVAGVAAHLPQLLHVRIDAAGGVGDDVGAVALAAVAADAGPAGHLERHAAADAVEVGLVGVGIAGHGAHAHAEADVRAHAVMRLA